MSKPHIQVASEASFHACVPDLCERHIVYGSQSAFVLVPMDEPTPEEMQQVITDKRWLPRGLVGLTLLGEVVILHNPASPDFQTVAAAARFVSERAEAHDPDATAWMDTLLALPDSRTEGEVDNA